MFWLILAYRVGKFTGRIKEVFIANTSTYITSLIEKLVKRIQTWISRKRNWNSMKSFINWSFRQLRSMGIWKREIKLEHFSVKVSGLEKWGPWKIEGKDFSRKRSSKKQFIGKSLKSIKRLVFAIENFGNCIEISKNISLQWLDDVFEPTTFRLPIPSKNLASHQARQ